MTEMSEKRRRGKKSVNIENFPHRENFKKCFPLKGKCRENTENFPQREKVGKYREFPREGKTYILRI